MKDGPRHFLEQLCLEREIDFRTLSLLLGRDKSYIQQYVRRGVPKRLGEDERRKLARYFGVAEAMFGKPEEDSSAPGGLVGVPRHAAARPYFAFDGQWVQAMFPDRNAADLAVLQIEGDAMSPTLNAGDTILIDTADGSDRLRDGLYALQANELAVIRRIVIDPFEQTTEIRADNESYPRRASRQREDIHVIGRVVWFGRRLN